MFLYNKTFSLKKGLRFSSYIKKLDEQVFPPYLLLIEKTDDLKIFNAEIILNEFPDAGFAGFRSFGPQGVLLNKCTIQRDQNERSFTISASISGLNLIIPLFYLSAIVFLLITGGMSLVNLFGILIVVLLFIFPLIVMYSNERRLLIKIGQMGTE